MELQVKEVIDTGLYKPCNIYNMDETGFHLSTARRARRVAPVGTPIKAQASLATSVHISLVATISTSDAPVDPYIIYPGKNLMDDWFIGRDPKPDIMAAVSESGFINGFQMKQWLEDCFDPATCGRAGRHLQTSRSERYKRTTTRDTRSQTNPHCSSCKTTLPPSSLP